MSPFKKNSSRTIYPTAGRIKGYRLFPKGIRPKVKVLARPEFELAYNDSEVHCFNHYISRTPQSFEKNFIYS